MSQCNGFFKTNILGQRIICVPAIIALLFQNLTILLMGCKEEDLPREPSVKPLFLEDMNVAEIASVSNTPAGLANLGNTCYMNATVQCLKTVTELRDCLKSFKGGGYSIYFF